MGMIWRSSSDLVQGGAVFVPSPREDECSRARSPIRGVLFGVLMSLPVWAALILLLRHVF